MFDCMSKIKYVWLKRNFYESKKYFSHLNDNVVYEKFP